MYSSSWIVVVSPAHSSQTPSELPLSQDISEPCHSGDPCDSHPTGHPVSPVIYIVLSISNFLNEHLGPELCALFFKYRTKPIQGSITLKHLCAIKFKTSCALGATSLPTPASSIPSVLSASGTPADAKGSTALSLTPVTAFSWLPAWLSCVSSGVLLTFQ